MQRRHLLRHLTLLLASVLADWLRPATAKAAWPSKHFFNDEFSLQFQRVYADHPPADSEQINISLPSIAEDGTVVPITISSELPGINHISIWVEKNPTPLAAEFELNELVLPYLTARIKMAESSHVIVIARQGERLLRAQQWVKVMQGGCGTG